MANLTAGYTFGSSETVTNTKLATLVNSGSVSSIVDADVSAGAAIAYSKLSLGGHIADSDVSTSAGILASKLDLTSPGAIGSTSPGTGAFTTLKVGTTNQGDVLYDNGTSLIRLTPGTAGQVLKTGGAAANPSWANGLSSVSDYGTSTSSSTARQATATKVAYGTTTSLAGPGGTFVITNLPFTSSSSYMVFTTQIDTGTTGVGYAVNNSASQCTITNASVPAGSNVSHTFNWFAIGT